MSSNMRSRGRKQRTLIVPDDILNRKLPLIPIAMRKLPALPQSKSLQLHNNRCEEHTINNPTKIITTHPEGKRHSQHTKKRSSLRNLITNIQKQMSASRSSKTTQSHTKNNPQYTNNTKSKWRPSLQFIIEDTELLQILTRFMTKQYNEENILFLQSVTALNNKINPLLKCNISNIVENEKINAEITSIYNIYIINTAEKQINLSSSCFNEVMYIHPEFINFPLNQKAFIFHKSYLEIVHLIETSILSGFYTSNAFQCIAHYRNILYNDVFIQKHSETSNISDSLYFDYHSVNTEHNKYMLSSKGCAPNSGIYEWNIKIIKSSQLRQEFGIVSICDRNIATDECGICGTTSFGARSVYGFNHCTFYYCSLNKDNSVRLHKDLSSLDIHQKKTFNDGDIIRICLNTIKNSIKYYLNGHQVRKIVSLQKETTYYPIILYSGECEYKVVKE